MIKLSHISKTYYKAGKAIKAVDDVSLEIRDGEIFGVIGFSGAGKSTLVRCINMLEHPDEGGKVEVGGEEITSFSESELRAVRSKIGMIFQHFNLMPSRTVLENVLYPLQYRGIPKAEQRRKALKLLELVELSDRLQNYPRELSGGQKQRVAIARALASDPQVLLCDEATSALDPTTTLEILRLLKKLNQKLGLTIVIITHQLSVVKDICKRVAVMEHGKLVEQGDVFSVFANPQKEVTRNFLKAATSLSKADVLAKYRPDLLHLQPGEKFVRLTYTGPGVSEPLISTVSNRFFITMNILFADVDLVDDAPIGGTVGVFSGEPENIDAAIEYLRAKQVKVEVLAHA
jgi:D-methionine transport system ATP-binding protein